MYVPSGYWHMVLNVDETIAVTHNYVSSVNFKLVWEYVKDHKPDLLAAWRKGILDKKPELLEVVEKKNNKEKRVVGSVGELRLFDRPPDAFVASAVIDAQFGKRRYYLCAEQLGDTKITM